jgi:Cofilin/tropomyosin-type actin-binding protein
MGNRKVITFITYIDQDNTSVKVSSLRSTCSDMRTCTKSQQSRMTYASSRETLKNSLNGIGMNWQANEPGELEWAPLLKEASKGKASA